MMFRTTLAARLAVALAVIAATVTPARSLPLPGVQSVRVEGEVLVVEGGLDSAQAERVARAVASTPGLTRLRITSAGGQAPDGRSIGELVHAHGLDVEVVGYCNSACAQYVFVAARRKIVAPGAVVAFHGTPGAMAAELARSPLRDGARVFADNAARDAAFYERIAVDSALLLGAVTYLPPFCVMADPGYPAVDPKRYGVVFAPQSYVIGREALASLGVRDTEGPWPADQAGVDALLRSGTFKPGTIFAFVARFDRSAVIERAATIALPDCLAN